VNRLRQFWNYAAKVFGLPSLLASIGDQRPQAVIPTRALVTSLFLGALLRVGSLLQLEVETKRKGWQRIMGWWCRISDDAFAYALERLNVEDVRSVLIDVNKTLKGNKALDSAKIGGLLIVALDGNEQFKSRHRCCESCCQRQIELKDAAGQSQTVTEYYHRQVYAQIHGPHFSTILDLEPIGPGEEEVGAALRLLGRMRRLYGPRFFDVITVDAWYATGPFIKAVQRLGWGVVAVLKQQRYEIYGEATRLSVQLQTHEFAWRDRRVKLKEVKDLPFTDEQIGPMRVVIAEEEWSQNQQINGKTTVLPKVSHWRWLVDRSLDSSSGQIIHAIGHQRWGVENHAFNELTKYYSLTHCPRHEPGAILIWLLFRVLGFNLFEFFVRLNGKLWREGRTTLQAVAKELDRALEKLDELEPLWSG
jgi:hypothetical protein